MSSGDGRTRSFKANQAAKFYQLLLEKEERRKRKEEEGRKQKE